MRVKIIPICSEKELNKILEDMENKEHRQIEKIQIVGKKVWILSQKDSSEEIEEIKKEIEKIKMAREVGE